MYSEKQKTTTSECEGRLQLCNLDIILRNSARSFVGVQVITTLQSRHGGACGTDAFGNLVVLAGRSTAHVVVVERGAEPTTLTALVAFAGKAVAPSGRSCQSRWGCVFRWSWALSIAPLTQPTSENGQSSQRPRVTPGCLRCPRYPPWYSERTWLLDTQQPKLPKLSAANKRKLPKLLTTSGYPWFPSMSWLFSLTLRAKPCRTTASGQSCQSCRCRFALKLVALTFALVAQPPAHQRKPQRLPTTSVYTGPPSRAKVAKVVWVASPAGFWAPTSAP